MLCLKEWITQPLGNLGFSHLFSVALIEFAFTSEGVAQALTDIIFSANRDASLFRELWLLQPSILQRAGF